MKKKPTKKVGFFNAMRKYFVEIEKIMLNFLID